MNRCRILRLMECPTPDTMSQYSDTRTDSRFASVGRFPAESDIPKRIRGMLALVMFLNGLAVMVLEMAGARLLAPWLGTSVIVWTSLIGVILASLSLGYWLGGRLADKTMRPLKTDRALSKRDDDANALKRAHALLSGILVLAATLTLLTALTQSFVLGALSRAIPSLHLAAVVAALLLFAGPSFLCGMASPYAMRLAITHSENAGAVIGRFNAISTVGSIAGTFLGGFILVSWFGSMEITLGVAACLLIACSKAICTISMASSWPI
jgi:MFS family permease